MARVDGLLARTLDFGEAAASGAPVHPGRPIRGLASLRPGTDVRVLSSRRLGLLPGRDKYKVLDRRRRVAQIKARHAMDLIDVMAHAAGRS
jgi:hypothetical protein